MIIKPKVRGFVCVTTHPAGCKAHIEEEIAYVKAKGPIANGPKRVLVVGASTGYGLSSRIVPTYAWGAQTIGVFFERPSKEERVGTAGWYNSCYFKETATADGYYARNVNGDAFSHDIKKKVADLIEKDWGGVDLIVYSLASPRRKDPDSDTVYQSAIKPIGSPFSGKSINTDKETVIDASIEPATNEEIEGTIKVMGGEDWELWINYLKERGLLAENFKTMAYSYIGPEVTWAIYRKGTIGKAKEDLERAAKAINESTAAINGNAFISVNKAVVSQASAAIPVVPLYNSILLKVMAEQGVDENIVQQIDRLYREHMYGENPPAIPDDLRVRIDDLELGEKVQAEINRIWPIIDSENLHELSGLERYKLEFLKLFGFGYENVDYDADIDVHIEDPDLIE